MQEGAAMRARLEAEMMSGLKHAGMRQLCLVLAGMMRGRMGAALQSMRLNLAEEKRGREMRKLESLHDDQLRSAAVREMRAVLVRLHKGAVAMHIERWRSNLKWSIMQ